MVVLAAWLAVVYVFVDFFREIDLRFWFFYDDSYSGARRGRLVGRAACGSASSCSRCCSRRPCSRSFRGAATWITTFGQATMYIYLLHSFVLYPIRETGVLERQHASAMWLREHDAVRQSAISIALASPLVRRIFRPLVEPKPRWLFKELRDEKPSRVDPTGSKRAKDVAATRPRAGYGPESVETRPQPASKS